MSGVFPNLPPAIDAWIAEAPAARSLAALSRELNVSRATLTRWYAGEDPEVGRIREVAQKLGVTVGYLADDDEFAKDAREARLLRGFRSSPVPIQRAIEQLAAANEPPQLQSPERRD